MRLLVTGGAGFIGSHVADAGLSEGWRVDVLDDLSSGRRENVPSGATLHEVDVRDAAAVNRVFAEVRPDLVSHQAAQASVSVSVRDPVFDAQVNVLGGLNVLEACVAHGTRRLVFASTGGAIYGEVPEPQRAGVGWKEQPISPYAASKLAFEGYLPIYRERGLETVTLRYANVYGARQNPHGEAGVVAIFAERLLRGDGVKVFAMHEPGDGGCIRDYVAVEDVVRANLWGLREAPVGHVLDVGTGVATTTAQVLEHIVDELGVAAEVEQAPRRPGDLDRSVLDPTAVTKALGALVPLSEGLARTARWFADRAG